MKRLGLKGLMVAGMVAFSMNMNAAFSAPLTENKLVDPPKHKAASTIGKQKSGAGKNAAAINKEPQKIKTIKSDTKTKTGNKKGKYAVAVNEGKRDLKKAKFHLYSKHAYYVLNRKELRKDHLVAIEDYRKELKADRKDLCTAKMELRKQIKAESRPGIVKNANTIVSKQQEIRYDQTMIKAEKKALKSDMQVADRKVK